MTDARGYYVTDPLALRDAALFTDFYERTMGASYLRERMHGEATFSLFVRRLPPRRGFLVAALVRALGAGLEPVEVVAYR